MGFIYIVIPDDVNFLKIGYSKNKDSTVISRYSTYYPSFTIFLYETEECCQHEKQIFALLGNKRLDNSHELFVNDKATRAAFFKYVNSSPGVKLHKHHDHGKKKASAWSNPFKRLYKSSKVAPCAL